MGDVIQWAPALAGIVIAVTLVMALFQLVAIRKLLEKLLEQRQMPAAQPRAEGASEQALWTEETPEPALRDRRLEIVSPPPPPAPVQQARFEAAKQAPPAEEIPAQGLPPEVSDLARPAESPATANLEPPPPTEPRVSRLPVLIGIVVLLGAIGFLAFLVLYTK